MIKKLSEECLSCINKPCVKGCPLENDITGFIKCIKNNKYKEAYNILSNTTCLMSICGRVCPHSKLCEGSCIKNKLNNPVKIGKLESMIGDLSLEKNWNIDVPKKTKYNVAVVGSGPSSLTCASFLRRNGIGVTVYEKYNYLGGLLVHGIPDFRLDKNLVKKVIDNITLGMDIKYNMELGKDITLDELKEKHDAVFIGIGANVSNKMNIEGEDLEGVYGANEVLEHNKKIDYNGKTVLVIGGGNVAVDIARVSIKHGAKKVIVVYRRSKNEMPADIEEVEAAINDGVEFLYQTNILKILGTKQVEKAELIKTKLVEKENEDRLIPINIDKSNYTLSCDIVMKALGSHPDHLVATLNLDTDKYGKLVVDEKGTTSDKKVFSGGDVAGTPSTVSWASVSGRKAAYTIIKYLGGEDETKIND